MIAVTMLKAIKLRESRYISYQNAGKLAKALFLALKLNIISYGEFGGFGEEAGGVEGGKSYPGGYDAWAWDGVDGFLGYPGNRGASEERA
jgi:hypothetical protein